MQQNSKLVPAALSTPSPHAIVFVDGVGDGQPAPAHAYRSLAMPLPAHGRVVELHPPPPQQISV
jgi:hypothetical protein